MRKFGQADDVRFGRTGPYLCAYHPAECTPGGEPVTITGSVLVWASVVTVKSDKEEGLASLCELVVSRLGHPTYPLDLSLGSGLV